MTRHTRRYFVAALTLALALLITQTALAHARLLRSSPEDGAALETAPGEVYLWFDEPVAAGFSSVEVFDAEAQALGAATLRGDPSDATLLIAALPELSDGVYSLKWRVLSNTDSHLTQGALVFSVGQAGRAAAPRAAQLETPIPSLEVILRGLNYATLAGLVGSLLVAGVVLQARRFEASVRPVAMQAQRRVIGLGLVSALAAWGVGLGLLVWQAEVLLGVPLDALLITRFGGLWLARQSALLLALAAWLAARRERSWGWPVASLATVVLAVTQALNSHAAGLPERSGLAVAVSALHLLAAGAWVGSLFALLVGLLPLLRSRREIAVRVALGGWRRFGALAALSVGALAASGAYNAARQVASIDAWVDTTYGRVLAGKSALFLLVGLAGLLNSILLHPHLAGWAARALRRPAGWQPLSLKRLPVALLAEASLAVFVFAASGLLTAAPPARGPEFLPPQVEEKPPSSLVSPVDDLLVNLSIKPNKPGLNIINVDALNTRRPPPAETLRVLIRLRYLGQDLGTQTLIAEPEEADRYRLSTSALSLSGAWEVQVAVRRRGMEDSVARFDWRVESLAPSEPPRPVIISNAPLEPWLTGLAGGLAALTGLAAIIFRRTRRSSAQAKSLDAPVTLRAKSRLIR